MTMPNNLKVLTQLQVSSTTTLSIELGITYTFACAFLQLVRNSEIVSENSQPSSMSVQSTGSFLGPNKPWFLWLIHSCQVSNN